MARYIDADLLLAELEKQKGDYAFGEGNEPLMCWEVADLINDQDTADVEEVKHGEWIVAEECKIPLSHGYIRTEKTYICSCCHHHFRKKMKFCGECGAKMDGGKEG
jgi:hypothetical protein